MGVLNSNTVYISLSQHQQPRTMTFAFTVEKNSTKVFPENGPNEAISQLVQNYGVYSFQ